MILTADILWDNEIWNKESISNIYIKYCCWNEYRRKILSDNEIYFTSPAKFNDPFDCMIPVLFEKSSLNEIANMIKLSRPELSSLAVPFTYLCKAYGILDDEVFISKIRRGQRQYICEKIGIFSLSGVADNILMWSHYSDSHRGFCIEFNRRMLDDFLINQKCGKDLSVAARKVSYVNDFPLLKLDLNDPERAPKNVVSTKAENWRYEKEIRYIMMNGAGKVVKLPNGIISGVILGCRISSNDESEIIAILKNRPNRINLFRAKERGESFGLKFETMDY